MYVNRVQEHSADVRETAPKGGRGGKLVSMMGFGGSTSCKLDVMKDHVIKGAEPGSLHDKAVKWDRRMRGLLPPAPAPKPIVQALVPVKMVERLQWAAHFAVLLWLATHFVPNHLFSSIMGLFEFITPFLGVNWTSAFSAANATYLSSTFVREGLFALSLFFASKGEASGWLFCLLYQH